MEGLPRYEATLEACRLRLRPILMTSFAFIIGVIPLVVASGAGAEMRRSLGIAVFSGMVGVTLFGIFLTPVFFSVILGLERNVAVRLRRHALGRLDRGQWSWLGRGSGFLFARLARLGVGRAVLGDRAWRHRWGSRRAGRPGDS